MLRLNLNLIPICFCIALSSCQSVQEPKPETIKAEIKKEPIVKAEPTKDNGLDTINIAIGLIKDNDLETAEDILKVYLTDNNDNRAQLNLALIYMKTNKLLDAKKLFIEIQETDATNSIVLEHLAIIARQEGQFKQAKELYLQALDNSDKPSIHLNYAILLDLYLNDLKPALKHYEVYQSANLAEQDGIELEKWIADLKVRIKRSN